MHRAWQEVELSKLIPGGFAFPLLSDPAGRIGRAYGVYDEVQGIDLRGRFLIDPDGVIQAGEVLTPAVGRSEAEMLRQLQAFQTVRASGGALACPAGWHPGGPTLEPGPKLVGHVWETWAPGEGAPASR